ncbi:MAG: hypothetical protein AB1Z65_06780 [Candidatus Sulfomarinibacteraceae bacterium]
MKCAFLPMGVIVLVAGFVLAGTSEAQTAAPPVFGESTGAEGGTDCDDGVVKDDGTIETGYGWVPSVIDGRYVQQFELDEFRSRKIEEVCVCWTRNRLDDTVSFTVELYRDVGGRPSPRPEASVATEATLVPTFPDGGFYSVDVSDAAMLAPTGTFYIGVKWNPSEDGFFFVCVDQSDTTEIVDGWFIDDRADEWTSVLETSDPIFIEHRAMMIRARAAEGTYPLIPTLGTWGLVILIGGICVVGALVIRRRDPGL